MRITKEVEEKILKMIDNGERKKDVAKKINCSLRSIFYVINKNKNCECSEKKCNNLIQDVISLHLLKNCQDVELLTKMILAYFEYEKNKKIIVPKKLQKIIKNDKIEKIINNIDKEIEIIKA